MGNIINSEDKTLFKNNSISCSFFIPEVELVQKSHFTLPLKEE